MNAPLLAKDLMRRHVLTLTPQMPLREAARLFSDHGITGAPVLCKDGKLIGVLSQSDIVRQELPSEQKDPEQLRVEQAMTPWVVSFEEGTPVLELTRQMLAKRIHRVLITRAGELCGIVTSMDILRAYLVSEKHAVRRPAAHRSQ